MDNESIFICLLPPVIQDKIKKLVTRYLKKEGCFSLETIDNVMDGRFTDLYSMEFIQQYKLLKLEIENNKR